MKKQIRLSVWETNSSSTHSLTMCSKECDMFDILKKISDGDERSVFGDVGTLYEDVEDVEEDDDKTLYIRTYRMPSGDEQDVEVVRFCSNKSKLSFVLMQVWDYIVDHSKELGIAQMSSYGYNHITYDKVVQYLIGSPIWKVINGFAYMLANDDGYEKYEIILPKRRDDDFINYHFYCDNEKCNLKDEYFNDIDKMKEYINDLVFSDKDIVYSDLPYNAYGGHIHISEI